MLHGWHFNPSHRKASLQLNTLIEPNTSKISVEALTPVAYPGILFRGGGGSTNSVEERGQRERSSGGDSPLVKGSGGSCNLVQEISFHIVKFS